MRSCRIRRASVAVVCPMILLAGCADRQRPAVEQTATAFLAAVGAGDTRAGCALLAPATRDLLEYRDAQTCVAALTHLPLPTGSVLDATEWGGTAQVHTTTDTLFLTRTSQGWRIAAAGCQSRGDAPYACKVEGP
jgi:hypothetical protein